MSDLQTELTAFVRRYELATNEHDFDQLVPLIAEGATYWFTEGSYHGIEAIRAAIERTFATILDEVYEIRDLEWVAVPLAQASELHCHSRVVARRHITRGR